MGISYSYECVDAEIVEKLGKFGDETVLLCNLRFVDEHGHHLQKAERVVVGLDGDEADIEDCPENFLGDDHYDDETYSRFEKLCDNNPGWDVYNPEGLAAMLRELDPTL